MTQFALIRRARPMTMATLVVLVGLACGNTGSTSPGGGAPKQGGQLVAASWQEQDSMLATGITDSATHAFAYEAPMVEGLLGLTNSVDIPKLESIASRSFFRRPRALLDKRVPLAAFRTFS